MDHGPKKPNKNKDLKFTVGGKLHAKFEEAKHKRGVGGKFTTKPDAEKSKPKDTASKNAHLKEKGKTSGVSEKDVIKLHVNENPKKAGSQAATDFAQYKDGMTVGEFKSAVGPKAQGHLSHDMKKGFISIHDPKDLPPVKKELQFSDYVITSKTTGVKPTDQIKVLVDNNPKKPGSKSAADFAKYEDEMTVADFHAAVGDKGAAQSHILHDLKKGYISVHDPEDLTALRTGAKSPGQVAAEGKAGDKKLGVVTANPYTEGSQNHQDFEDHAKKLGLTTAKTAAATAPQPKPPGQQEKPPPIQPKPEAKPTSTLAEDDVIESYLGNKFTVKDYKQATGADNALIEKKLADGSFKKVPKVEPTAEKGAATAEPKSGGLSDKTILESKYNTKITVEGLKKIYGGDMSKVQADIDSGDYKVTNDKYEHVTLVDNDVIQFKNGNVMSVGKYKKQSATSHDSLEMNVSVGNFTKVEGSKAKSDIQISEIKPSDHAKYTVTGTAIQNPYKEGSPEWIKYKALEMNPGKSLTIENYMKTKALDPDQKIKVLQQMVDEGHVKLVTPENKAAVEAQKAAAAAKKAASDAEKAKEGYKLHYELVKENVKWHDDAKWSTVIGIHDLNAPTDKKSIMWKAKEAIALPLNNRSVPAVNYYTGSGYSPMNKTLRSKKGYEGLDDKQKQYVKILDKMTRENTTKEDIIMWRGIGTYGALENFNNMPPPLEIHDMGFSSMSHNPNVSLNTFAGNSTVTGKKTLFRVRVPKGTKAAFVTREYDEVGAMNDEAEIIAARGTRFKYVGTQRNVQVGSSTIDVIEVEIVGNDGANI